MEKNVIITATMVVTYFMTRSLQNIYLLLLVRLPLIINKALTAFFEQPSGATA